ncbi:MAG: DUF4127 family protein [Oscillospiraceae bacterium]|nr:DUF4127 family protein [Oscillospiraceae bacterium]
MKRILALLLVFCLFLTAAPMGAFAAETANPATGDIQNYFYKIMHLDAARKYFSVENIKDLIDVSADAGFNQIELYLSDNQGFRLGLDDMTVTTKYGTYDMSPALGAGYSQAPHYTDGKEIWLTQAEMDEIIAYANSKGLDVVPCINAPGHMGALLEAFPEFRYGATVNGTYTVSKSALNIWNEEAYAFGLAFIEKYAQYFKSRGVKTFNFGADEFGCDMMTNSGTGENNGMDIVYNNGGYDEFVDFINDEIALLKDMGLQPRAFSDCIYYTGTDVYNGEKLYIDTDLEICYWNGGWYWSSWFRRADADYLASKGFRMINTNGDYYHILGGDLCTPSEAAGFDYTYFHSFDSSKNIYLSDVAGAMFCIWCDDARDETCTSDAAVAGVLDTITAFGSTLPTPASASASHNGITVTAPGLTAVTATEVAAPQMEGISEIVAYNVSPATAFGSYYGSMKVSVSLPAGFNASRTKAALVLGGDTQDVTGKIENGNFVFTMSYDATQAPVVVLYEVPAAEKKIEVNVNETFELVIDGDLTGSYTASNPTVAGVTVDVTVTEASVVPTNNKVTSLSGGEYFLYNGTDYLVVKNGSFTKVSAEEAAPWTATVSSGTVNFKQGSYYLSNTYSSSTGYEFKALTSAPYTSWKYDSNGLYAYIYGANYYFCYNTNGWFGGDASNAYAHYMAYEAEQIPASAESVITFEGLCAGTTEVEIGDTNYVITVTGGEATEPEITEPQVTEPQVTEPEVTEPEVTEPEVTEPEVTEPEVTEPEVTEPEVTEPEVDPDAQKIELNVNETVQIVIDGELSGSFDAEDPTVAGVDMELVATETTLVPGSTKVSSLSNGQYYLYNGSNYLIVKNGKFAKVSAEEATPWTATVSSGTVNFKQGSYYLSNSYSATTGYEFKSLTTAPYASWKYDSNGIYANLYGANYYFCYNTNGWFGGDASNAYAHYVAYKAEEVPTAYETVITFEGLRAGTTQVEINGTKYVIIVTGNTEPETPVAPVTGGITVAYVPLDNRPVNVDRVIYQAGAAGFNLVMPAESDYATVLAGANSHGGSPENLLSWLKTQEAAGVDHYVISLDQMFSGGLCASRTLSDLSGLEYEIADYLVELAEDNYVVYFDTVVRLAPETSYQNFSLDQYNALRSYGSQLRQVLTGDDLTIENIVAGYRYGQNGETIGKTYGYMDYSDNTWKTATVQDSVLNAHLAARERKLNLIDYVIRNVGDNAEHLYIGVDDSSANENIQYNERQYIHKIAQEYGVNYQLFAGADELGMMGIAALAGDYYGKVNANVTYFGSGADQDPADNYDYQSLRTTMNLHLEAIGVNVLPGYDPTALQILVLTQDSDVSSRADELVAQLRSNLEAGIPTCVLDCSNAGANNARILSDEMLGWSWNASGSYALAETLGISCWNTAANTIGIGLGNAVARYAYIYNSAEVTEASNEAFVKAMTFALVKDISYRAHTYGNDTNNANYNMYGRFNFDNSAWDDVTRILEKLNSENTILGKDGEKVTFGTVSIDENSVVWTWGRDFECSFTIEVD